VRPQAVVLLGRCRLAPERRAGCVRRLHVSGEGWLKARVGHRLEAGGQLDERRLAERRPQEADSHRHPQHLGRRHLHDRVPRWAGQPRAGEEEVVGEDQIGGPAGAVGGRHHRIEVELAQRRIDAVRAPIVIHDQRLVVSQPAEERLQRASAGLERLRELEDLLEEERHLLGCVGVVEGDSVGQRLAGHRHAHPRGEVFPDIDPEVEEQH